MIASTDCGFGTFAGAENVVESVVWAKLQTLRQGADLASARLWGYSQNKELSHGNVQGQGSGCQPFGARSLF